MDKWAGILMFSCHAVAGEQQTVEQYLAINIVLTTKMAGRGLRLGLQKANCGGSKSPVPSAWNRAFFQSIASRHFSDQRSAEALDLGAGVFEHGRRGCGGD